MSGWDFFDSIRCINLYEREDRYQHCKQLFKRIGISVDFYRTERDPNGGHVGCYNSHIKCIKESYDKGDKTCLIFEDDVVDSDNINDDVLRDAINFMSINDNWDILYLGANPRGDVRHNTITEYIMKGSCTCTHAYIIHRRFMERIINIKYDGTPINI